MDKETLKIQEF